MDDGQGVYKMRKLKEKKKKKQQMKVYYVAIELKKNAALLLNNFIKLENGFASSET